MKTTTIDLTTMGVEYGSHTVYVKAYQKTPDTASAVDTWIRYAGTCTPPDIEIEDIAGGKKITITPVTDCSIKYNFDGDPESESSTEEYLEITEESSGIAKAYSFRTNYKNSETTEQAWEVEKALSPNYLSEDISEGKRVTFYNRESSGDIYSGKDGTTYTKASVQTFLTAGDFYAYGKVKDVDGFAESDATKISVKVTQIDEPEGTEYNITGGKKIVFELPENATDMEVTGSTGTSVSGYEVSATSVGTFTAYATASALGSITSETSEKTFTVSQVATPTGSWTTGGSITLSCSESGATINYTLTFTDGSASQSGVYSSPLNPKKNCTVSAYASKSGYVNSTTFSGTYQYYQEGDTGPYGGICVTINSVLYEVILSSNSYLWCPYSEVRNIGCNTNKSVRAGASNTVLGIQNYGSASSSCIWTALVNYEHYDSNWFIPSSKEVEDAYNNDKSSSKTIQSWISNNYLRTSDEATMTGTSVYGNYVSCKLISGGIYWQPLSKIQNAYKFLMIHPIS